MWTGRWRRATLPLGTWPGTWGSGAGMGLPNMKRYSDEMRIDTTVGVGTTVTMRIDINNG